MYTRDTIGGRLPSVSLLLAALAIGIGQLGCNSQKSETHSEEEKTANGGTGSVDGAVPVSLDASSERDVEKDARGCPVDSEPAALISNFDELQSAGGLPPRWFRFNDLSGGVQEVGTESLEGNIVLHSRSSGFLDWGSAVGISLSEASRFGHVCPLDARQFSGLSFRARGRGQLRVRMGSLRSIPTGDGGLCSKSGENCYDWPERRVGLGAEWRTYHIPFCAFIPIGWSGQADELEPVRLGMAQFVLEGDSEMWLDDVQLSTEAETECSHCPLETAPIGITHEPGSTYLPTEQGLTLHTFDQETEHCGALERRYLSYVPQKLALPSSGPVLFSLHGQGANAESAQREMAKGGLDQLAAREGLVVVYGNAAPGKDTSPDPDFANTGGWRQAFVDDGQVDDVEYLRLVMADLRRRGVIGDGNSVYLIGLSNGGGMVLKAAKEQPQRFAGVAALMPFDGDPPAPPPDLSGSSLKRVLLAYTENDPGLPEGYHRVLETLPPMWASAMGLTEEEANSPAQRQIPNRVQEGEKYNGMAAAALSTRDSAAVQWDYGRTEGGPRLRVVHFDHAGHFWPHPTGETEQWAIGRWGFRNQDWDATEEVWAFFSE